MNDHLKNVSVSSATLRESDLINAFHDALMGLDTPRALHIQSENAELYLLAENDAEDMEYPTSAAWLLDDLFDALNECAPDGYYFGAHPGDDSDFGFWEVED